MKEKQEKISKKLQEILLPEEQICWQGTVQPFHLLENDNRGSVLWKWIGAVVIAGGLCALSLNKGGQNSTTVVAVISIIALCVIFSPVMEWMTLRRYRYWLTDKRAVLMSGFGEFHIMELKDIDAFRIMSGKTGGDCLIFGSQIMKDAERQLRWQATHPRVSEKECGANENLGVGMIFYGLADADKAAACLTGKVTEIV